MELYKYELKIWLCFAVALITGAVIATWITGYALCMLVIFFAFTWDFEDAKKARDAEIAATTQY